VLTWSLCPCLTPALAAAESAQQRPACKGTEHSPLLQPVRNEAARARTVQVHRGRREALGVKQPALVAAAHRGDDDVQRHGAVARGEAGRGAVGSRRRQQQVAHAVAVQQARRPAVHQHLRGIRLADYGRVRAAERGRLSRALAGGAHGRAVCMRPHAAGPRAGPDCLHTVSRSRARQRPHGHPPQHRAGQAMNSLRAPPQPAPHRGHVVYGAAKGQLAVLLHRFHGHERAVHDEAAPAQSTLPL